MLLSCFIHLKLDESIFCAIILIEIDFQFLFYKSSFSFFINMLGNTATKLLPVVTEEKKIDVSVENGEAVLKLSTWTENLGWTCQKTMRLEAELLDDLHRAISAARYRLNSRKAETDEAVTVKNNVLEFPVIS